MNKPDLLVDELLVKIMQSHIETALEQSGLKVNEDNVTKVAESLVFDKLSDNFCQVITGGLSRILFDQASVLGLEAEH